MKLQFDANQGYQLKAIKAVVDIFEGQPFADDFRFEIRRDKDGLFKDLGVMNILRLDDNALFQNVKKIQKENQIKDGPEQTRPSNDDTLDFSIEMETGTGKTYVYLRTIYELNKKYGFKKFIIVVPNIAIREGVLKNLQITKDHFAELYENTPVNTFVYDSRKLGKLHGYAQSNALQILVMNIDSFNKDMNVIHRPNDRLSGAAPIEFIQLTNPIVILDEPQNMESENTQKAIKELNPLCTLRYSATHKNYYNLLYRLGPVQAYDLGLVKKIEVDSVLTDNDNNSGYIEVNDFVKQKTKITAKLTIAVQGATGITKKQVSVTTGKDLYEISGNREVYKNNYTIEEIDAQNETVTFTNGLVVQKGRVNGGLTDDVLKMQIKETVIEHLEKEKRLSSKGIKVLTLFFIDKVANYRNYENGTVSKGKFAQWFESIYEELSKSPKYKDLEFASVGKVHDGYFSKDKQGGLKDTSGDTQADYDTYDLIMKDKERLLSLEEPLKFIFSHSALREGWDNPNVFQICTLNETKSEIKKRQEIGRGLRLPVNQLGERIFDATINRLTVVANESYEDFARTLQTEIEQETGEQFGKRIANKRDRRKLGVRKGYQLDENFKELWGRIKHKTRYSIEYSTQELITKTAKAIQNLSAVTAPSVIARRAELIMSSEGVTSNILQQREKTVAYGENIFIPNILEYLQAHIGLTRVTLVEILKQSGRISDFIKNPQLFLDMVLQTLKQTMEDLMIDGIKYEKIAGQEYEMHLFESIELESYLEKLIEVENKDKTIYDYIMYDSGIEERFAKDLESREDVKFYVKLPYWFKIETPIGNYNPDWAIVFENDRKVYFVAETKSNGEILKSEEQKIACGKKHFEVMDHVRFERVESLGDIKL